MAPARAKISGGHRQHGEERRLRGQPGDAVAHRGPDGRDDDPPAGLSRPQDPGGPGEPRAPSGLRGPRRLGSRHGLYRSHMTSRSRVAHNQAPPLEGHNVVTADAALVEAVTRHAGPEVVDDLLVARRRGRHRRGPRARPAGQPPRAGAEALRPLGQPGRRGGVPPVVALADGTRRRARPPGRALGAAGRRRAPRPRTPGGGVHGLVPHRSGPRLPDLDDLRRGPGAAGRRGAGQGVDPGAGLDVLRPGAAAGRPEARRPRRHGHDREAGRLRRPRQRHRGAAHVGRRRVHPARAQVVHLGADERRVPGARAGSRRADLLPAPPRPARRHAQPARRRPAQGQARQPRQRVVGAGARRHARRCGSATRAAGCARSSRWSRRPGSTACSGRPP